MGLSPESANLLKQDAWKYLEADRNKDPLFMAGIALRISDQQRKVSPDAIKFLNGMTDSKAKAAAEKAVRLRYGHTKTVTPAAGVKKDAVAAPTGTAATLDSAMTQKKYGADWRKHVIAGKAYNSKGQAIVRGKGGKWSLA